MAATQLGILNTPELREHVHREVEANRRWWLEQYTKAMSAANRAFLEQSGQIEVAIDEITINPEADAPIIVQKIVG